MLGGFIEKPNGFWNIRLTPCRGPVLLPPKGPSQAVYDYGRSVLADKKADMPRSSSANVLTEEQPAWLDDLLNEPDTPVKKAHRRSESDPFAFLDEHSRAEELYHRNIMGGSNWGLSQASSKRDKVMKPSFASPPLPNGGLESTKEDADFKALGMSCSLPELDREILAGDATSHTSENSSGGSDCSKMKPPSLPSASKNDTKRKQNNARRSRVWKFSTLQNWRGMSMPYRWKELKYQLT